MGTILFLIFFGLPALWLLSIPFRVMSRGGVRIALGIALLAGELAIGYYVLMGLGGAMSVTTMANRSTPAAALAMVQQEIEMLKLLTATPSAAASDSAKDAEQRAYLQFLKTRESELLQEIASGSAPNVFSAPPASNAPPKP
jgi:hydrogenase maturation factor